MRQTETFPFAALFIATITFRLIETTRIAPDYIEPKYVEFYVRPVKSFTLGNYNENDKRYINRYRNVSARHVDNRRRHVQSRHNRSIKAAKNEERKRKNSHKSEQRQADFNNSILG